MIIIDDNVLLVGHHDEGKHQQMSRQVISSEVEEIRDATIEYLALLGDRVNRPKQSNTSRT
jgi:hypothetical protein